MPRLPGPGPRIPPLPPFLVFTDRDDGTLWVLTFAEEDGQTYIAIDDQALNSNDRFPVAAQYVGQDGVPIGGGLRLFVRGGRLGYEEVQYVARRPVWARKGVQRKSHEIRIPASYVAFGDELGWEEDSPIP